MKRNYKKLEAKLVKYQDLISIVIQDNKEPFVKITDIPNGYQVELNDMQKLTNNSIFVRKSVFEMLTKAQQILHTRYPTLSLFVTYGFRDLDIQTKNFVKEIQRINQFFSNPTDLYEEAHRFIAVPTVAGHATGGAIDISIIDVNTKKIIDFGSKQYDLGNKDCYTFSPYISKTGKTNRTILRDCLMSVGFAPFDGEWWHFSYGDREWAYYYKKPFAIYKQKVIDVITINQLIKTYE